MTKEKLLAILDKNINQEQLAKDVAAELLLPQLEQWKADIESKKIDPIKGTDLENIAIAKFLEVQIAKIKAV